MALGVIVLTTAAVIEVCATVGGTYSPVSDLRTVTKGSARTIETFPVLQRATAHSAPGTREVTLALNGYLSKGDTGQNLIRSSEVADITLFFKILPDGTNGITQEFRVGSKEWTVDATTALQGTSFELGAAGDEVVVGSGLTF